MHRTIYSAACLALAHAASERCAPYLGVAALAASLNWVDLSTSELAIAARATRAAAVVGAAGGTAGLTTLLAGVVGVNLALGEL